jgi:hypothetical protein
MFEKVSYSPPFELKDCPNRFDSPQFQLQHGDLVVIFGLSRDILTHRYIWFDQFDISNLSLTPRCICRLSGHFGMD